MAILAGCNQIYGLDKTHAIDAGVAPDAPPVRVKLSFQVATTMTSGNGPAASPMLDLVPITSNLDVKIGKLDDALTSITVADGTFIAPDSITAARWRMEYTPPNDVPHEIQWQPAELGHITLPVFGRISPRSPAPTGSAYRITSSPLHSNYANTIAFTTGVWSQTPMTGPRTDPVVVNLSSFKMLDGAQSAPDGALNDYVMLADVSTTNTNCPRVATGAATFKAAAPVGNTTTDVTGAFSASSNPITISPTGIGIGDFEASLGNRKTVQVGGKWLFGRIPSAAMPLPTTTFDNVPAPVMLVLMECLPPNTAPNVTTELGGLPAAAHVFISNLRQPVGATVGFLSSVASVAAVENPSAGTSFAPSYEIPFATGATIGGLDLTLMDEAPFTIPSTRIDFTFQHAGFTSTLKYDYFEVLLFSVNRSLEFPIPVRVYASNDPIGTIRIDPSVFKPGIEYVFAVRTYRGAPRARLDDYTEHSAVQTVATIFFRTFTAQ